jgi:hypothetical protein
VRFWNLHEGGHSLAEIPLVKISALSDTRWVSNWAFRITASVGRHAEGRNRIAKPDGVTVRGPDIPRQAVEAYVARVINSPAPTGAKTMYTS